LERETPDVVHCHLLHDHWMAALAIRGMRGKRPVLVRTVHRYEPMRRDPLHRGLFERHTQVVTTVSSEQQRIIGAAYPGLGGRLVLVHGGVNPERFRPDMAGAAAVRADLGEKPDACVVGIVAHLGYNRGHRWLLEAAPAALARAPKGTIWIVGQGELKYDLREQVKRAEFRGQVIMTGYRGEDLPDVYAAMDAGLLLGLGSEGSARAAMEAMSAGRPVIGVRKGALLDLIRDGENGFLVAENDVRGLADALGRLLADRPLARTMGEAARKTILAGFTEETRAARTLAIYEKALAGRD
jgi:glycosyltransferase involved in cell wall biosynthesis